MIKKGLAILLALMFFLPIFPVANSSADGYDMGSINEEFAIVVDASNPTVAVYGMEKNADALAYPASTTKILTCIIALENCNLDDLATASANATNFSVQNSLMGLVTGEQCTIRDLLYGLMLVSGNDAAVVLAEHISGSQEAFATLMNAKAQELGMANSHFVTPNGRHNDEHYSTARDMAVLTAYALQNEAFREIVGAATYTTEQTNLSAPRTLTNSNRLLIDQAPTDDYTPTSCLYADAIGVKTGDTDKAGKCLIAAAERDGTTLIAVLFKGSQTNSTMTAEEKDQRNVRRFTDAIALFEYAFNSMVEYITVSELVDLGLPTTFSLQAGNYAEDDPNMGQFEAVAQPDLTATISFMSNSMNTLKSNLSSLAVVKTSTIYAPVNVGDIVGTVDYVFDDRVLFSANLVAQTAVAEGILATTVSPETADTSEAPASESPSSSLISSPTPDSGSTSGSNGSWIWYVIIAVAALLVILLVTMIIIRSINERKRKKARERRRQQQMRERMLQQQRNYRRTSK
ncbi:MAG: D-alanyl-D-alanine carboxypeptidase family protein [Clostridia bacterium]|nr:D-alanyl-D-alanine carboxypeptidase family protein [Clostridia bacterium]